MSLPIRQPWGSLAWVLAGAASVLLLLLPAFYNRYPIVFYDTGGYIERWFSLTVAMGRSLAYGLFLGVTAGGLSAEGGSLWGTIAVQALMSVWVLHVTARSIGINDGPIALLLTAAVLTAFTGLPWYAAQLMPDVLEPLMVLAMYVLAFQRSALGRSSQAGLVLVIALAVACHMAHLALALGLLGMVALVRLRERATSLSTPAIGIATGIIFLLGANALLAQHMGFTPGGESFIFGRLVQDGIAQRFLNDNCPSPEYRLCDYRDRMPRSADDWNWGWGSPLNEIGGWSGGASEMARISQASLALYPVEHLEAALASTARQLLRVRLGDGLVDDLDHTVYVFQERLSRHNSDYLAARQQNQELGFTVINRIQVPIAFAALILLTATPAWLVWHNLNSPLCGLCAFVLIAILGNAFICAVLSNPHDRYQNRMIWLAFFCLILVVRMSAGVRANTPKTGEASEGISFRSAERATQPRRVGDLPANKPSDAARHEGSPTPSRRQLVLLTSAASSPRAPAGPGQCATRAGGGPAPAPEP